MGDLKSNKLSAKEWQFCLNYVKSGDAEKAAVKAGYGKNALKMGNLLINKKNILAEIDKIYQQKRQNLLYKACCGYEKLAFGNITDAVKLLYSRELDVSSLKALDLFNVSEIKLRDGALEIKFFDRLRALEKLQQMDFGDRAQASSFYEAIEKGAAVFKNSSEFELTNEN